MPGNRQGSRQVSPRLFPGQQLDPGYDCRRYAYDISAVVHSRSPSRPAPDASCAPFPWCSSPRLIHRSNPRWFTASPCRAAVEGLPPSPAQHRDHQRDLLHRNLQPRSWRTVIGVPDQPVVGKIAGAALGPLVVAGLGPPGELVMCSSRTDRATLLSNGDKIDPCGVPALVSRQFRSSPRMPGLQERLHQGQDALIPDARPHPVHEAGMRDLVEAGFDVSLNHPLATTGRSGSAPRPPRHEPGARAEPVRAREEIRLEDWLQHHFHGCLDDPVRDAWRRTIHIASPAIACRDVRTWCGFALARVAFTGSLV